MNIFQALLCLTLLLYCHAILPPHTSKSMSTSISRVSSSVSASAFVRKHASFLPSEHRSILKGLAVRGGDMDETDDDSDDETDSEEYDSEDVEDLDSDDEDEEAEEESDEEDEDEDEEEDEDEDEEEEIDEDEDEEGEESSTIASSPAKITLKTALTNNILIDQSIEITASPTRNVQSLKQSVSRQFKSRPPMDAIVLRLDGQVLDDDTLVQDLVDDMDEDDEDDDDEEEGDDDGLPKLTIIVDMVPPVDPKFGTEMKTRLDEMTNEQVLDAYVANLASMHQNSMDMMEQSKVDSAVDEDEDDVDEEDDDDEESISSEPSSQAIPQTSLDMQRHIMMLREQVISNLSEDGKKLLEKKDTPSSPIEDALDGYNGDLLLKESIKRKKRRGGATMNVKRALQKNLNINWPDTIRNFLLFLFFGYFGGRDAMSRTIMLLGAPACFIIQARPVKVAIKQLFYTIGEPPGILLSLLPAPQQAIMSCDYDEAMRTIYGDQIGENNDLIKKEDMIGDDYNAQEDVDEDNDDDVVTDSEDEYDEYDEDY